MSRRKSKRLKGMVGIACLTGASISMYATSHQAVYAASSNQREQTQAPASLSNIATLSALTLNHGTLTPNFTPDNTDYSVVVDTGVSSVSVTPVSADSLASVTVNGLPTPSGTSSEVPLPLLTVVPTLITVVVTSQDRSTTKTYTVMVTKPAPTLTIQPSALPPAIIGLPYAPLILVSGGTPPYTYTLIGAPPWLTFSPDTGTLSGTPPISTRPGTYELAIQAHDAQGAIGIQPYSLLVTGEIVPVPLPPVVLTSASTTNYQAGGSPTVIDPSLTVSDTYSTTLASARVAIDNSKQGEDVLAFANDGKTMGDITGAYVNTTGVLTLTSPGGKAELAEWQAALRAVTYADTSSTPNTDSRSVTFSVNDGTFTSLPATKTVTVTLPIPSSDANLKSLTLSQGTLTPAFSPDTTDYTATVGNAVSNVEVTPTVAHEGSLVKVNNQDVVSGTSFNVGLNVGANTVWVQVTDYKDHTKTYTITITRQAAQPGPTPPPIPQPPLTITSPTVGKPGKPNQPFTQTLTATGGTGFYTWSIVDGRLPQGLTLNPTTGVISGSTNYTQPIILTIEVTDSAGHVQQKRIVVDALSQGDREMVWQTTDLHASNVPALVAMDAGTDTTFMPIWYVMQMLKSYGVTSTWDGHHWFVTAPKDVPLNTTSGTGNMAIYLNGHLVQMENGTYAVDPNSKHMTTFMPIWYVQQLMKALNIANTWDGTTWIVALPDATSK